MKNIAALLLAAIAFMAPAQATDTTTEKPIQHLKVADVNSMAQAKKIFLEKSFEIKGKQTLDNAELQQIHVITYTLEKSVAYFAENLTGEPQQLAKEIADVVENIHLNSENNRKKETEQQLARYFTLANTFITKYWKISTK